ncbi:MAG TPA: sugar phosphate isomerase/epimerase [Bryobacteraceae bacterium]
MITRRHFLSTASTLPLAAASARLVSAAPKHIPIGLELYSVRKELAKDLMGTVRDVAKLGYECVEFYAPYFKWTPDYAKEVRAQLDGLGINCWSTHNDMNSFTESGLQKAIELNRILGSRHVVLAHPGDVKGLDGWKHVADTLNKSVAPLKAAGMSPGYHNHDLEFHPIDGKMPIDIIAGTEKGVGLQVDTGGCLQGGGDPVALIRNHPGRVFSLHCKDYSHDPAKGFRVVLGDGDIHWKQVIDAARKNGALEYFLIEQEGADMPPMETAGKCLANFKKLLGEA